ncbi:hypothetical protein HAX54_010617 [Datura stramonium]|uniref:Uncharacterized protein n=1 Tax=Datura stramonium TaxID=4076 RepID=A0ABS8TJB1_DATST|nr:hypothetical protein [Datura stramonium]
MKATWGETSDEESEVEDVDKDNLALMAKSDTDSDNDSSEVSAPAQNEGTLLETNSSNVPSEPRQELENSGGTIPETMFPDHIQPTVPPPSLPSPIEGEFGHSVTPLGGSPDSSMATAPTSLSPDEGLAGSPNSSSPAVVDLSTLLEDIRGRYTSQGAALSPSSLTKSGLVSSNSDPIEEDGKGDPSNVAGTSGSVNDGELQKLHEEIDRLHEENRQLKTQLEKNEETTEACHNDLMTLIRSMSPLTVSSPPIAPQSFSVAPDV